jgi:N-acetylglucosamine-6-phosphate deacetylase
MSVEFEESPPFVSKVAAGGVIVAIGHTAADSDQIRRAVDAGARMSTHLGNGSHPMLPRHRNYIWDQLAEDRLTATLIVDGHHLPPPLVKTFLRAKTPERCVLISDISGLAGLPPGRHRADTCELEILPNGKLVLAGQREILAGASAPLGAGIANAMHFAGVDLETAVRMAVAHPARILGATPPGLAPGDPADLVLFYLTKPRGETGPCGFEVLATILDGQTVHGSAWQPDERFP